MRRFGRALTSHPVTLRLHTSSSIADFQRQSNDPSSQAVTHVTLTNYLKACNLLSVLDYATHALQSNTMEAERAQLSRLMRDKYYLERRTIGNKQSLRTKNLRTMSQEHSAMVGRTADALASAQAIYRAADPSHIPAAEVIAEAFTMLSRIDSTNDCNYKLVRFGAQYVQDISSMDPSTSPSVDAVCGMTISPLRSFCNANNSDVTALVNAVGDYISRSIERNGLSLQDQMQRARLTDISNHGSFADFVASDSSAELCRVLSGVIALHGSPEVHRLIQLMFIHYSQRGARQQIKPRHNCPTSVFIAAQTTLALQAIQSSCSGGNHFSLAPIWSNSVLPHHFFSLLPSDSRWECVQRWYHSSEEENFAAVKKLCTLIDQRVAKISGVGIEAVESNSTVCVYHEDKLYGMNSADCVDLTYHEDKLFGMANSCIGFIDKCCAVEGPAFTASVALVIRQSAYFLAKSLAMLQYIEGKENDVSAVTAELKRVFSPLQYLGQSIIIALPRIQNIPNENGQAVTMAVKWARALLFKFSKIEPMWEYDHLNSRSPGGLDVRSVSERRISNSILRLLKWWRADTDGKSGENFLLKQILSTMVISTNEILKGMPADIVLRAMLTLPAPSSLITSDISENDSAAVVKTGSEDRRVHFTVDVEVDGDHHKVGRRIRFQQLRDAHLTRQDPHCRSPEITVVLRLLVNEFTPLSDTVIDSYVEVRLLETIRRGLADITI